MLKIPYKREHFTSLSLIAGILVTANASLIGIDLYLNSKEPSQFATFTPREAEERGKVRGATDHTKPADSSDSDASSVKDTGTPASNQPIASSTTTPTHGEAGRESGGTEKPASTAPPAEKDPVKPTEPVEEPPVDNEKEPTDEPENIVDEVEATIAPVVAEVAEVAPNPTECLCSQISNL